ncbi:MAG TPA: cytochrome c oxidase subunit II [Ilumatobacter sp.]|nr:cytochrome c oxidase subunit II [Ilumatobacter sp.]
MTAWQSLPGPPLTSEAERVRDVWTLFALLAAAVGLIVVALVVYCVIRFRKRDDRLPRQKRYNIPIEVAYTSIPLLIVIILFVVTAVSVRTVDRVRAGSPDVTVEVLGFQWQWQFTYPDQGVVVTGTDEAQPELVLPSESRVRFRLTSADVIHAFWIPGFRYKRDVIPGEVLEFDVNVLERTGDFPNSGICAEFCGVDHAYMRFDVRIVTRDEFQAWAAESSQQSPAEAES